MNAVDWAYFAGLFDGEGTIGLQWNHYPFANHRLNPVIWLRVTLNVKESFLLERFKAKFGGRAARHRTKQAWAWAHKPTSEELDYLKGFLILKAPQAELAIKILSLKETGKQDGVLTRATLLEIARLAEDLALMHGAGPRRIWTYEKVKETLLATGQGSEEAITRLHNERLRRASNRSLATQQRISSAMSDRMKKMWANMDPEARADFMENSAWKNQPKTDSSTGRFVKPKGP